MISDTLITHTVLSNIFSCQLDEGIAIGLSWLQGSIAEIVNRIVLYSYRIHARNITSDKEFLGHCN